MYVCMYAHIYIYIYIYVCISIHTHAHIHKSMRLHIHIHVHIYIAKQSNSSLNIASITSAHDAWFHHYFTCLCCASCCAHVSQTTSRATFATIDWHCMSMLHERSPHASGRATVEAQHRPQSWVRFAGCDKWRRFDDWPHRTIVYEHHVPVWRLCPWPWKFGQQVRVGGH